ncbi:MAG TPA: DegT/DnrJ/EryC1/StrS family aminotransferase [bacterium]|nr:DegT/DnrJ/EryC1/StrS family aminotransferase [bacterium]
MIPFLSFAGQHPALREQILAACASVYDGQSYILGPAVSRFEEQYAAFCEAPYAIGVGNGLDALTLSLRALGVGPGDEVIVPSNTYIASWLAVTHAGATPVPVEPEPGTFNLDPAGVRAALTPRTRALLPVHLFGQPCRMDELLTLARRHDLLVVEDNAQAHGARWQGRPTGSFGHCAGHSFYPTKNLGALGDAGAVTTPDAAVADRLRRLRNYGSAQKYHNGEVGWNSRLDELQAAILSLKLPFLPEWNAARQRIAAHYLAHLADLAGELTLPVVPAGAEPVWHQFVVRTPRRDQLQAHLTARGIGTLIHYPVPPHRQPAYAHLGFQAGQFPLAEAMAATSLSLPIWPGLTPEQLAIIVGAIRDFFREPGPGAT